MGKAKKEVHADDDDAIFAQRAIELKGASPPGPLADPRGDPRANRRSVPLLFLTRIDSFATTPPSRRDPHAVSRARLKPFSSLRDVPRRLTSSVCVFKTKKTDEAKALFSKGFILKAAAAYDQALKLVSPDDPRAGEMHRERAICFMYAKQYADVVVESTRALKSNPTDATALFYRAKAYEVLGQGKKAKADAAAAAVVVTDDEHAKNSVEAAKVMLLEKDSKPAGGPAGLGGLGLKKDPKKDAKKDPKEAPLTAAQLAERQAAQARQAEALRQRQNQAKWGPPVAVKATCGDDARVVIVPSMISHKDLMTTLQRKFPDQSAFTVRFTDADGASKPLNSRADFATAFVAAQAAKAKAMETDEGAKPTLHNLPVLKLSIVEHSSATATEGTAGEPDAAAAAPLAPNEVVEIDEWILDFAALFREHLGIDAEAHLDLHAEVRARFLPRRVLLAREKRKKEDRKRGGDDEKPHDYPERTLTNVLQMSFAPIASRLGDDRESRTRARNECFFVFSARSIVARNETKRKVFSSFVRSSRARRTTDLFFSSRFSFF